MTPADVAAADTVSVQTLKSGDVIVGLRQRLGGVEVLGSEMKVMMRGDRNLVAISGRPRATSTAELRWEQSREAALAAALSPPNSRADLGLEHQARDDGRRRRFRIAAGARWSMSEAAPVRPVMFPAGSRLIAAYVTEFYAGPSDSADAVAFRYVIAADDGRVLERRDLTVSEKKRIRRHRRRLISSTGCMRNRRTNGHSTGRNRT